MYLVLTFFERLCATVESCCELLEIYRKMVKLYYTKKYESVNKNQTLEYTLSL